jgi:hypothetical protein
MHVTAWTAAGTSPQVQDARAPRASAWFLPFRLLGGACSTLGRQSGGYRLSGYYGTVRNDCGDTGDSVPPPADLCDTCAM